LFSFKDPSDFDRIRSVLRAGGHTDAGVLGALGIKKFSATSGNDVHALLRRTMQSISLGTLIRLFLVEVPVDVEAVRRAIRPMKLETCVDAGLIQVEGGFVFAGMKLLPYRNLILAFDLLFAWSAMP
jgi:hypothetical protein